jgi:hypothetical protein
MLDFDWNGFGTVSCEASHRRQTLFLSSRVLTAETLQGIQGRCSFNFEAEPPRGSRFVAFGGLWVRGERWSGRAPMRCLYCSQRAGIFRSTCAICAHVINVVDRAGAEVGLVGLVDIFAAEGLRREQVDRVLDAEIAGNPTLRDRMTAQMANLLMRSLGMPGRQSPEDVRRVRLNMAVGTGEVETARHAGGPLK